MDKLFKSLRELTKKILNNKFCSEYLNRKEREILHNHEKKTM